MEIAGIIAALVVLFLALRAASSGDGAVDSDFISAQDEASDPFIRRLLHDGKKIQAIKAYRTMHSVDLTQAKEAVERLARELEPLE